MATWMSLCVLMLRSNPYYKGVTINQHALDSLPMGDIEIFGFAVLAIF